MKLCILMRMGIVGGPAEPLCGATHHTGRTRLEVGCSGGAGHLNWAAVLSVEAGHPHVRAEQQVIFLFAQVENSPTKQTAGDERTAHRHLDPSPAAPAVAGITVNMLSHPGGSRAMTLGGKQNEMQSI